MKSGARILLIAVVCTAVGFGLERLLRRPRLPDPTGMPLGGGTLTGHGARPEVSEQLRRSYQGPIAGTWVHRGVDESILIRLQDTSEIAACDLASGELRMILSPVTAIGGIPAQPLLAADWRRVTGPRNHETLGYIYSFTNESSHLPFDHDDDETISRLILVDSDRDGSLDYTQVLTPQGEVRAGLKDDGVYID